MDRLILAPIGIASGLLAGFIATRVFDFIWSRISDEEAPRPDHREVSRAQLALSLIIEGAIFRLVKGEVDRGTRVLWYRSTGSWPGEDAPEPV